jgi:Sec-independent protein translocase protein TatA
MFGVGGQEVVLIVLLVLVIFGPSKLVAIARDLGRFAYEARSSFDELKLGFDEPSEYRDREPDRELKESELKAQEEKNLEEALEEKANEHAGWGW